MIVPAPQVPMPNGQAWPDKEDRCTTKSDMIAHPCLAFLEFDDFGESWQKNPSGRPAQLQRIVELISTAKKEDPGHEPIILTFLHGWKHNASGGKKPGDDDSNIIGFATVLNKLHHDSPNRAILGIYFAWRGGLISPYWPVSQQLSYWNREATAMRVGNTSLTEALIEISDTAWTDCPAHCPVLVYVGHSFGALALERALTQATATRMERDWQEGRTQNGSESILIHPLASLVIYVNSAAAAIESKQLMDYLASSRFTYRPDKNRDEPLFLSVTSQADLATGLALKIGHAVPLLGYKRDGSMRAKSAHTEATGATSEYARACFDPAATDHRSFLRLDLAQSDYYMSTAAHLQPLWSHQVIQKRASGPEMPDEQACSLGNSNDPYMTCRIGDFEYTVNTVQNRCNGTPYWVMEVPKEIIPDHGTIFTGRLITFLMPFINSTIKRPPQLMAPSEKEQESASLEEE
jgi:hypothetical protein